MGLLRDLRHHGLGQGDPDSYGLRRSSQGRAAVADHRRPIRSRRPHLGIHHSTVLANGLHLGSRPRPRYLADRAAMVVLPPEAAQMAEDQTPTRPTASQRKRSEVFARILAMATPPSSPHF